MMKSAPSKFSPWEAFVAGFGIFLTINVGLGILKVAGYFLLEKNLTGTSLCWLGLLLCLAAVSYLLPQLWSQLRLYFKAGKAFPSKTG